MNVMTRTAPHAALHSLAANAGCRCPQCGGGRAAFDEFDESDEFAEFDEFDAFDEGDEIDEASDEVFRALGGIASAVGGIGRVAGSLGGVARAVGGIGRAAGSLGGVARGLGGIGRAAGGLRGLGGVGRIAGQLGRAGRATGAIARAGGRGGQLARLARAGGPGGQLARLARAGGAPAMRQLARAARSQGAAEPQPAPRRRAATRRPPAHPARVQARMRQIASGTLPRRGRRHDPRRPMGPQMPPHQALNQALRQTLQSMGWSDWQRFGSPGQAQAPNMQQLADLGAAGGVEPDPADPRRLRLSNAGRRMIASGGQFAGLAPLFSDHPGQADIYRMQAQGQQLYIGRAGQNRPTGLRIMEHLVEPRGIGPRLRQMAADGQLGQVTLDHGTIDVPDAGARSHLAEGALMQIHSPLWNDQRRHGFDEEDWI